MREFQRVLIANRGEIALRVLRTLRALDIESVLVYSDADAGALAPSEADRAVRLPGVYPEETYLDQDRLVEIARQNDCDALHPGYGFLAENAEFARRVRDAAIAFIGPSTATLVTSGNKLECKRVAGAHGVPVVPYSPEPIEEEREAVRFAEAVGFPVLLKSAFGGGGRGIKEARTREDVREAFASSRREAQAAFGRSAVFIEKRIVRPRHIEVQLLASRDGEEVLHLGERECSIQRRYQKLVEISPSPVVDEASRERLVGYAITMARALRYTNAGTVEFLRDPTSGEFYFLELNARLQVEHPITELRTGVDLVESQIHIARHGTLPLRQKEVEFRGTAIECRINSEDPLADFAPAAGTVSYLRTPSGPGIRVDSALRAGMEISPYYDSLLAKLVAWGPSFEAARRRALAALKEFTLAGVPTTIPLYRDLLANPMFVRGELSTSFLEESGVLRALAEGSRRVDPDLFAVAALLLSERGLPAPDRRAGPAAIVRARAAERGGRFVDGL